MEVEVVEEVVEEVVVEEVEVKVNLVVVEEVEDEVVEVVVVEDEVEVDVEVVVEVEVEVVEKEVVVAGEGWSTGKSGALVVPGSSAVKTDTLITFPPERPESGLFVLSESNLNPNLDTPVREILPLPVAVKVQVLYAPVTMAVSAMESDCSVVPTLE